MARSDHLPIYKAAYDLCLWLEQVVRGFPRYHKYAIGSDLRDGSRRVLRLVVRANASVAKTPVLLELREEIESLKAMLRLAYDAKAIAAIASFEHGARMIVEIAKQNEGWLRSQAPRESGGSAPRGAASEEGDAPAGAGRPAPTGRGQNRSGPSRETAASAAGVP